MVPIISEIYDLLFLLGILELLRHIYAKGKYRE